MKRYGNISRKSGVTAYKLLPDGIEVKFVSGETYHYSFRSAGEKNILKMQELAESGKGLSTYISRFVKDKYEV